MPYPCSICEEEATRICVRCTKDACDNHLCEKCQRCSDCCECEVALTGRPHSGPLGSARAVLGAAAAPSDTEPEPDVTWLEPILDAAPLEPALDPDPFPDDDLDLGTGPLVP
jgi:hypothetical protein